MSGGSRSSTTQTSRQDIATTNIHLADVERPIIGSNNRVFEIDPGSFELASDALETVEATTADAFDFGRDSLGAVIENQRDASDLVGGVVNDAFRLVSSGFSDALAEVSFQVDRTTTGLREFALVQSETDADQAGQLAQFAMLAVVAAVVLPQLFKG